MHELTRPYREPYTGGAHGEPRIEQQETRGHVSFYERDEGVLFDGDVVFAGSVGRTDLPGASTEELMASINEKIKPLPAETQLYPGHGPPTTLADELRNNPVNRIHWNGEADPRINPGGTVDHCVHPDEPARTVQ